MDIFIAVVCTSWVPLTVCSCGNEWTRHRHKVNFLLFWALHFISLDFNVSVLLNASICSFFFSSLSQWVHACDALQLPGQQREQLDSFIDQLYKDIEKGRVLSLLCSYITVNNCCLHWIDLFWTHHVSLSVSHCLNSCVKLCRDQQGRSFFFLSSVQKRETS